MMLGCLVIASASEAHHGSNGQFDSSVRVNVTGTVTKLNMVNPHAYVYFDVLADNGEIQPWRCELRSGSILKRSGWTEELFTEGTEITIEGAQARREEFGCMLTTITFADGRTYARNDTIEGVEIAKAQVVHHELAAGIPDLNGNWVAPPRTRAPAAGGAGAPGGMAAPVAGAAGGMGAPPAGGDRPSPYQQTEAGIAAVGEFDREMNPRYHCQATNIFHDWTFDQHVNKIEQTNDKIVMTYGFMDIVRTIHLDMTEHPSDITPSRAGHSIGKWEGETLIVDTIGFEEGWLTATFAGIKHSDQLHVTEKFYLSDDGNSLIQEYEGVDPLYLSAPFSGQASIDRTDVAFDPYACEDLTEERVPGF